MKCKITICLPFLVLFFISCSDTRNIDQCTIDKGIDKHRELSNFTSKVYLSFNEDTVRFCNSQNDEKWFRITKNENDRFWRFSYIDTIENCEYKYLTHRDYNEITYSNINETQQIFVGYYTSGYTLKHNDVDSLIALYDLISFSSENASSVGAFMINRNEGQIEDFESPYEYFFKDLLKIDTTINNTHYDSIYILPNDFQNNLILYSIPDGIIQFEHDSQIWNLCN